MGVHEFITTSRGRNGGLKLARPAEEVLLSDVVRKAEPDMDMVECFNPKADNCVTSPTCRLKSMMYEGRSAFMAVLEKHTLADVAGPIAQSKSEKSEYVNVSQLRRQVRKRVFVLLSRETVAALVFKWQISLIRYSASRKPLDHHVYSLAGLLVIFLSATPE